MTVDDAGLERIWSAVPIADVVRKHVELRPVGRNLVGRCPFHLEQSTGSFNVREDTGRFKCFGCGAGGEVVVFVMMIEKIDFAAAAQLLAAEAGIELS
jgi:DNA primase